MRARNAIQWTTRWYSVTGLVFGGILAVTFAVMAVDTAIQNSRQEFAQQASCAELGLVPVPKTRTGCEPPQGSDF